MQPLNTLLLLLLLIIMISIITLILIIIVTMTPTVMNIRLETPAGERGQALSMLWYLSYYQL